MSAPTLIHSTGAELHWATPVDAGGKAPNDPAHFEIYRGTSADFTPSPATLIATVATNATSFVDTSAPASGGSHAGEYDYMVAVRTNDGQLIPGPTQFAQLPPPGESEAAVSAVAAVTIQAGYPDTSSPLQLLSPGYGPSGAERAVFDFGPLTAIPSGANVKSARLSVYCDGSDGGPLEAVGLTRAFDASTVTWNNASSSVRWTHPGGDYAELATAGPARTSSTRVHASGM